MMVKYLTFSPFFIPVKIASKGISALIRTKNGMTVQDRFVNQFNAGLKKLLGEKRCYKNLNASRHY